MRTTLQQRPIRDRRARIALLGALLLVSTAALAGSASADVTIDEIVTGVDKGRTTRAERYPRSGGYDVKIPPPARPGAKKPTKPEPAPAASRPPTEERAAPAMAEPTPTRSTGSIEAEAERADNDRAEAAAERTRPAAAAASSPQPATEPEPLRALTEEPERHTGPYMTIQVGAYRSEENAAELEAELAEQFSDTYVHKVTSGGKPLFRVRVGHFTSPERADAMRKRIMAAGYPAFQANEPGD